jgi:hypothetical protein
MRLGALNISFKLLQVGILPSNIINHSILMMLSLAAVLLVLLLNGLLTSNLNATRNLFIIQLLVSLIRDKGCRTWMLIMLKGACCTFLIEKQRT